jgi:hypothetical protein
MSIIVTVSSMIIPAIMLFIVGYGMIKKKNCKIFSTIY